MSEQALQELQNICLDGHLIDIDLSIWDQAIRFVIIACDFPPQAGYSPIYLVEFRTVSRLDFNFSHHRRGLQPLSLHGVGPHLQWRIHQLDWEESRNGFLLRFSGSQEFPTALIDCAGLNLKLLDDALLNKHYPGWRAPGGPFLRPGVEEHMGRRIK